MLHSSTARSTRTANLNVEALEDRLALSWGSLPPASVAVGTRVNASFDSNRIAWGQAAITRNEVDFYSFIAPVSGSYKFSAWNPNDTLDTVLGVYRATTLSAGSRIAYNDDVSGGMWSQVSVSLAAGKRYFFGITNYLRTANGAYYWRVDGPSSDNGGGGGGSDWFSQNLADAGIAQAARNGFGDNSLGRADLLAIFQQAKQDGTVNSTELNDMRLIVSNAGVLNIPDYVRNLANKVVNSDAANAHYLGQNLGNLSAGASGNQLQLLVNKWFLGLDHPVADNGSGTSFVYQNANGQLFVDGISYQDIHQGQVGDCYLLAGLAETALRNPTAIQNMFTDNGDGTFTVRFFNNGTADYVTVDRSLPSQSGWFAFANMGSQLSSASNELWVALAEKAYAQINESGWLRNHFGLPGNGINSYQAVAGGWGGDAIQQITGQAATLWNDLNATSLINAWNSGKLITLGSHGSSDSFIDGNGVVENHAYAMIGYNAITGIFTFFNPWGMNNGSAPDLVNLTFGQVLQSFESWDRVGTARADHDAALALMPSTSAQSPVAVADSWFLHR
jgi:hypothetical protein